jgi:hypothetical protein
MGRAEDDGHCHRYHYHHRHHLRVSFFVPTLDGTRSKPVFSSSPVNKVQRGKNRFNFSKLPSASTHIFLSFFATLTEPDFVEFNDTVNSE